MLEIKTYLDGDDYDHENVPYEEFFGVMSSDRDGAIEIIIDGELLFRYENEYIDIEWTGIIYRLQMFLAKEGKEIKNAPLLESGSCIAIEPVGKNMLRIIHPYYETEVLMDEEGLPYHRITKEGKKVAIVSKNEFLKEALIQGWKFFHKLAEIIPEEKKNYMEEELKWIEEMFLVLGIEYRI